MIERYNPSSRYRQRQRQRTMSFVFLILTMCFAVAVGFWFGGQNKDAQALAQVARLEALEKEAAQLRSQLTEALTTKQEADMRYQALQEETEALVPAEGPLRDLIGLLKTRLNDGSSPERLANIIQTARPPQNCTDPESKSFVVATPNYKGPESAISLDNGMIVLKAAGQSASSQKGEPEAWYDESQPIELSFLKSGGSSVKKTGTLPLSVSVVVQDKEYRFTFVSGPKSLVKVTYDRCDYP